jgi:hypothetical protein
MSGGDRGRKIQSVVERCAGDLEGVTAALSGETEDRGPVDESVDGGDGEATPASTARK